VKIWLKKFLTIVHKILNSVKTNENVKVRLWGTFSWMSLMQWNWKLGSLWLRFWITIEDVFDSNSLTFSRRKGHRVTETEWYWLLLSLTFIAGLITNIQWVQKWIKTKSGQKSDVELVLSCSILQTVVKIAVVLIIRTSFVTIARLSVCQVCRQQNAWSHLLTDYRFCCTR